MAAAVDGPPVEKLAVEGLAVEGLTCSRGERVLFGGLTFAVPPGGVGLVRGPNGSGKTTLLRVVAGLAPADRGTIRVPGALHHCGHAPASKPALTVRAHLRFLQDLLGGPTNEAVERLRLRPLLDLPAGVLSAGQRQRVALARLLVAPCPLWLLDEPTAALDDANTALVGALLDEHARSGGVALVATHRTVRLRAQSVPVDLGG